MDGHVPRGAAPDGVSIFVEMKHMVGGVGLSFTLQSHRSSFSHRQGRTLQDHSAIFKKKRSSILGQGEVNTDTSSTPSLCVTEQDQTLNVACTVPVMVMLMALLCSPLTDSHQYTPLSDG